MRIYKHEDFAKMRKAGLLASNVLDYVTSFVQEGVTTDELNQLCHDFIISHNAIPATLNYDGFPKSTCISLNHVVCHGIPGPRRLRSGDILNIDVTVILDGWYGDTSRMFTVGKISGLAKRLINIAYDSLMKSIDIVRPGITIGDIGCCIQTFVEQNGFSVVQDYCGHGIGQVFHDEPQVSHFGKPGTGVVLEEGMFFTIEPMINAGKCGVKVLADGWTAVTRDQSLSAQYEHSLGVTSYGAEIFTAA
ncbi:MAG: type I methionyl aminopeptidase [Holosporales bacterium]|jgi:methionyl aminopeptidase|nr:type I methionyl aminopeptidase [Holosporales bacterium]